MGSYDKIPSNDLLRFSDLFSLSRKGLLRLFSSRFTLFYGLYSNRVFSCIRAEIYLSFLSNFSSCLRQKRHVFWVLCGKREVYHCSVDGRSINLAVKYLRSILSDYETRFLRFYKSFMFKSKFNNDPGHVLLIKSAILIFCIFFCDSSWLAYFPRSNGNDAKISLVFVY